VQQAAKDRPLHCIWHSIPIYSDEQEKTTVVAEKSCEEESNFTIGSSMSGANSSDDDKVKYSEIQTIALGALIEDLHFE